MAIMTHSNEENANKHHFAHFLSAIRTRAKYASFSASVCKVSRQTSADGAKSLNQGINIRSTWGVINVRAPNNQKSGNTAKDARREREWVNSPKSHFIWEEERTKTNSETNSRPRHWFSWIMPTMRISGGTICYVGGKCLCMTRVACMNWSPVIVSLPRRQWNLIVTMQSRVFKKASVIRWY